MRSWNHESASSRAGSPTPIFLPLCFLHRSTYPETGSGAELNQLLIFHTRSINFRLVLKPAALKPGVIHPCWHRDPELGTDIQHSGPQGDSPPLPRQLEVSADLIVCHNWGAMASQGGGGLYLFLAVQGGAQRPKGFAQQRGAGWARPARGLLFCSPQATLGLRDTLLPAPVANKLWPAMAR